MHGEAYWLPLLGKICFLEFRVRHGPRLQYQITVSCLHGGTVQRVRLTWTSSWAHQATALVLSKKGSGEEGGRKGKQNGSSRRWKVSGSCLWHSLYGEKPTLPTDPEENCCPLTCFTDGSRRCGIAGACRALARHFQGVGEYQQTSTHPFPTLNAPYELRSDGKSLRSGF